jgi:hypothetical protein
MYAYAKRPKTAEAAKYDAFRPHRDGAFRPFGNTHAA